MALVPCKECEKQIAQAATSCPHCGIASPGISDNDLATQTTRNRFLKQRWIGGLPFWLGVVWLAMPMLTGGAKDEVILAWEISKWLIGFGVIHYVISEVDRNLFERKLAKRS
jgi:hypothetical protein